MKMGLLFCLILGNTFADVPSDIKRTQLDIEQGDVDLHRAYIKMQLGAGKSSSHEGVFKEGELKFSTKFIMGGSVTPEKASGFAIAPDLMAKLRLDQDGKKMRLEVGGKIISLGDIQFLFYKTEDAMKLLSVYSRDKEALEQVSKKITDLEIKLSHQKQIKNNSQEVLESENELNSLRNFANFLRKRLKDDKEARTEAIPFITTDFSLFNLGVKYKEVNDANFKFVGGSGSLAATSFDIVGKSKGGNIRMGLCGIIEIMTLKIGRLTTADSKDQAITEGLFGGEGSACLKFAVGPVIFNNTFGGGVELVGGGNAKVKVAHINNNARLGIRTGAIPGVITDLGAFYNYSKEWYPSHEIDSHMVGGGVTVMVK